MLDYGSNCFVITLFISGILVALVLLITSIKNSSISWTDHEYKVLPKAKDLIEYRNAFIEYSKANEIENTPDKEVAIFIAESMAECIDYNKGVNDYRLQALRRSIWYLAASIIPIFASSVLFVTFDLDVSSPRKNMRIEDQNLASKIEALGVTVSQNTPSIIITTGESIMGNEDPPQKTSVDPQPSTNQSTQKAPQVQKPKKPALQISTEDYSAPLPKKPDPSQR